MVAPQVYLVDGKNELQASNVLQRAFWSSDVLYKPHVVAQMEQIERTSLSKEGALLCMPLGPKASEVGLISLVVATDEPRRL